MMGDSAWSRGVAKQCQDIADTSATRCHLAVSRLGFASRTGL